MTRLVGTIFALALIACSLYSPLPGAAQVLAMPSRSGAGNAHLTISGWVRDDGVRYDVSGAGVMRFGRDRGMHVEVTVGGNGSTQVSEVVATGGLLWTRVGSGEWDERLDLRANDPGRWRLATRAAVRDLEKLPLGQAWHVTAVSAGGHPFEAWVRSSDGYPLRFLIGDSQSQLVLNYVDFNRDVVIPPPPSNMP